MYACLHSLTLPTTSLVTMAETFTPRFEVVGPLVMLDVSGVSRLFGAPRELGEHLRRAATGPVRIAIAPTQTAAALIALGRPGLTIVAADEQRAVLGQLPVSVLSTFERIRLHDGAKPQASGSAPQAAGTGPQVAGSDDDRAHQRRRDLAADGPSRVAPPHVGEMFDVLPYFQHSLGRTSDAAAAPHLARPVAPNRTAAARGTIPGERRHDLADAAVREGGPDAPSPRSGGWTHPRDAHAAATTRPPRRGVTAPRGVEHAHPAELTVRASARDQRRHRTQQMIDALVDTLRRWGVKSLAQLAALPPGEVYERLGARGVLWQRLARGEDSTPLVPWVPEDPFEASLDLEWPIEGLEPLSFVLGRLLEPLALRLERADRGAAILHTQLRLVDKTVHARMVQLPAAMRDPKTLRTLLLLDLESNPPAAGIDRVSVLIEPTPARVTQWALFERAQPSPEQVSTLLARLTALMGDSHVGSPRLVDSWKPGAFEMTPFAPGASASAPGTIARERRQDLAEAASGRLAGPSASRAPSTKTALRRFRLPVPARVQVHEGRPVRITSDRRGVTGGAVVQAAGPWRTAGEWWNDGAAGRAWDRDEWDVALGDGTVYRIYVERDIGHWFVEGVID